MVHHFYTDPLAAAWMAVHFGMRFIEHGNYSGNIVYTEGRNGDTAIAEYSRYTIHPDSLPIMEPRTGDFLLWRSHGVPDWKFEVAHSRTTMRGWDYRVFQRDGKPFFWPEV